MSDSKDIIPVTKDVLLRVLPLFSQSTKEGMTMPAALCLAFARFLRADEFTHSIRDSKEDEEIGI